jgi:parallel beta-helix repeat protein
VTNQIYRILIALILVAIPAMIPSVSLGPAARADERVIVVSTTIQAAVDSAQPGDTVHVPDGTYRENVVVTRDNITIEGSPGVILDGKGLAGDTGIKVASLDPAKRINGFTVSGLTIQNYSRNGVLLRSVDNFRITRGTYLDNDEYGIFPIQSSGGLIDHNFVSGSNDTGIYVGQSRDIVVEKNHAIDCTLGIEIELSSHIDVLNNMARANTIGIVVQILPGLAITVTSDVNVAGNKLIGNNRPNPVTDPHDLLSRLPSGIGFINVGGDRVIVQDNIATENHSAGIVVVQLPRDAAELDPRLEPFPDDNQVRNNVVMRNGADPDPKIAPFPGADLLWDLSGVGNCWSGNVFKTAFPALPQCP